MAFSWEFPPRAPKLDKDGNPIVRKPKAKADLSMRRAQVDKLSHGEIGYLHIRQMNPAAFRTVGEPGFAYLSQTLNRCR